MTSGSAFAAGSAPNSGIPALYPGAALIATTLGLHGYRKGSLSLSGAIAAFLVGYGHLANPAKVFGVTMIGMYLLGSRATKVKVDVKAKLEDGPDPLKPSGNRNWIQVLSNSLPGLLAALAYRLGPASQLEKKSVILALDPIARPLIYVSLGLNATILADTFASELGILSRSSPRHILTLQPVPKGTNGGVSPLGLVWSVAGGGAIGGIMALDLWFENLATRLSGAGAGWALELVGVGMVLGLAGSLLDSILGATLQSTYYSKTSGKILTDTSDAYISFKASSSSKSAITMKDHGDEKDNEGIKKIGFGLDVLSNSGVNFVTGCAIAAVGWWYGTKY
ncbi:hypothetical protein I316_00669 [Kwoniella heveanensis BCC8398]|uniref:TIGR00297 family protein n=1 Tax=Kwoniella heveanensis BCC8398 TaxID=1296120 RepID=A0A1B9H2P4_9TREE|nr:hypothetical protein I316_00669 [Kwoniella heveanensis BCC8398]